MKTWYSLIWWRIIILIILAINIEKCVQSSIFGVGSGFDQNNIDENLKILQESLRYFQPKFQSVQESLRWIRSPSTRARFRPWGGKRTYQRQVSLQFPIYNALCAQPIPAFDIDLYSKCQRISNKQDLSLFNNINSESEMLPKSLISDHYEPKYNDYDTESYMEETQPSASFVRGMPENVNNDQSTLENDAIEDYNTYMSGYPNDDLALLYELPTFKNNNSEERQAVDPWMSKRNHKFYPWAGKRDHKFYPWAGKRDYKFYPWAGKRDHKFYPWAGKRDHKFYPWAGKRSQLLTMDIHYPNTLNETSAKMIQTEQLSSPIHFDKLYNSDKALQRRKRELVDSFKLSIPEPGEIINIIPIKRSTLDFWKENTKRIGALSDLLKEFENIKDVENQRGFHPWAGKKRSERDLTTPILDIEDLHNSYDGIDSRLESEKGKDIPSITKKNTVKTTETHRPFYPWAGKRNFGNQHLVNWVEKSF